MSYPSYSREIEDFLSDEQNLEIIKQAIGYGALANSPDDLRSGYAKRRVDVCARFIDILDVFSRRI